MNRQKRLEQMQREFVANVSHEMKTPLCLLQMYAENLKYRVDGIDPDEYCDIIIDEAQRLSDMVSKMLELSAVENGLAAVDRQILDLSALCRGVVERMAPMMCCCRLHMELEHPLPVLGDAGALEMVLQNLLSNAVAHTPNQGRILVRAEPEEAQARLTVENEGGRLSPEQLQRVWDSFYKADSARVRTGEAHAGLGLAIVRSIVLRHGGTYRAENTELGVAFSITLPLAAPENG